MSNVVVIGAGPAGMMAASCAAKRGKKVVLIEKNKTLGNPFEGCERFEFNAHVNYDAGYKDMMLVKPNAA